MEWPAGIGAKGNEGVANNVAQTKGSIGYVEYAYAKQNKLTTPSMINKDGKAVAPTAEAFQAAAANADWERLPGFCVILTNEPGAESWPIAGATFILIHKQPQDPAAAAEALKFFAWAYAKGDKMAEDLDYVPMPDKVVDCDQEDMGGQDQGRGRQAAVHGGPLSVHCRERRRAAPFPVHPCANTTCEAARTRLEWAPDDARLQESRDAARREASRG